jgi:hypothetical protein
VGTRRYGDKSRNPIQSTNVMEEKPQGKKENETNPASSHIIHP